MGDAELASSVLYFPGAFVCGASAYCLAANYLELALVTTVLMIHLEPAFMVPTGFGAGWLSRGLMPHTVQKELRWCGAGHSTRPVINLQRALRCGEAPAVPKLHHPVLHIPGPAQGVPAHIAPG